MRSTRSLAFRLVLVTSGALHAGPAWATGQDLFGVGARGQAMAQTGVARGPAPAAAHTNPALLGGQEHSSFVVGFRSASFDLHYDARESGRVHDLQSGMTVGLAAPLGFGAALKDRLALGLSLYSPRRNVAKAELWYADRPQFPLLASQSDSLGLSVGLGAKLLYNLKLGVGVRWLAGLDGSVVASSDDEQEQTFTTMNTELDATLAPVVGIAYEPAEDYSLGLAWRDELESHLDVTVTLADLGTLVLPPMHLAGTAQYEPEQYELEAAYEGQRLSFVLGLRYRLWSRFPGFVGETIRCPSPDPCGTEPEPDPELANTLSPRAALAFRMPLSKLASSEVRTGVAYEPSPLPEQVGEANHWDNPRLLLTLGYGVRVETDHNAFSWDFALQTHRLRLRRHEKDPEVSSENIGFPSAKTWGHIDVVCLEMGVEF